MVLPLPASTLHASPERQAGRRQHLRLDPGQLPHQVGRRASQGTVEVLGRHTQATHIIVGERSDPGHSVAV